MHREGIEFKVCKERERERGQIIIIFTCNFKLYFESGVARQVSKVEFFFFPAGVPSLLRAFFRP